jgi:DNA polymerase I
MPAAFFCIFASSNCLVMNDSSKRLFLLDAMALIYRAFYALNKNPRINSKGINTSAVLGFTNTLWDVLRREKPTHIGVAFDTMAPTLRHEDFSDYKANRQEMPEDLAISIPHIQSLIEAFNIPLLMVDGYEADDVIGTLAKNAEKQGFTTYMMTSDKDFGQLVSENILMYKPPRGGEKPEILGVREVCEKYSLQYPEQMIDLLGLMGDASDNISGIPGVGEVTAKKLLAEYGSVENLIAKADTISNERWRKMVTEHADLALQSKSLATIMLDVPIDFDAEALRVVQPDMKRLQALFHELEFRGAAERILKELGVQYNTTAGATSLAAQPGLFDADDPGSEQGGNSIRTAGHAYHLAETPGQIGALISSIRAAGHFCFDTETTGLDIATAELVGISFSIKAGEAWFVPVSPEPEASFVLLEQFKPLFEDPALAKTGQNLKFDIGILRKYNISVNGALFDTMLAHYLLQPDMRHNMNYLAATYLNYQAVPIEALIGKKGRSQLSMRLVETEALKDYACEDADITLQLRSVFEPLLQEQGLRKLFDDVEIPLIHVLSSMEFTGVKIDTDVLQEYSKQLATEIHAVEQEIHQLAGSTFNIASPKQMAEVLYEKLKIVDNPKKTQTKQKSTAEDVLQKMLNKHPIISKILDYRELTKLKSTYVDALPALVNPVTRRLHASFNQAVAATGRLSSSNPNLQNIPIRTERGARDPQGLCAPRW